MRRIIDLFILLIVVAAGVVAIGHAKAIGDWWHAQRYQPTDDIVQLAEAAGMNDTGKKLFYRFSPQIVDKATLAGYCSGEKLGCTVGQSIYILEATDASMQNRNIVTAAHEMLHVAYSRLTIDQQDTLTPLLQSELANPTATDTVKQLDGYPESDRINEAHSFIGSQVQTVSPELETYYAKYFSNRGKTTGAFAASPER